MALYVRLMVYTGLSLFIIRWANVYLVVCVLTRITLEKPYLNGRFILMGSFQRCHGRGKMGNLDLYFSRQGTIQAIYQKQLKYDFTHGKFCSKV